ncbi:MAG TPA: hypothetical protein GX019_05535 [Firmicutes bacterium]|nr:hypothetical protein [Bacillota bacterium]
MIERYIYAVISEVPAKSRVEVSSKLRESINTRILMADKKLPEDEVIRQVLVDLGDPIELAERYQGKKRYLIGPRYYHQYISVLIVFALALLLGIAAAAGMETALSGGSIKAAAKDYVISLLTSLVAGAALITLIFSLLDYRERKPEPDSELSEWDPARLPELPHEKALISWRESLVSIFITSLFAPIFWYLADLTGIGLKPAVLIIFILNIFIELIKIVKGRWTRKTAAVVSAMNTLSTVLFIWIIHELSEWIGDGLQQFVQFDPKLFIQLKLISITAIIILTALEAGIALYKGFRYDEPKGLKQESSLVQ